MRLYLSSFRMGNRPEQLVRLVGGSMEAAVVGNAMDGDPASARQAGVDRELAALSALGFQAEELDLRCHYDRPEAIDATLARYGLVWLRGGNVFMLRYACCIDQAPMPLSPAYSKGMRSCTAATAPGLVSSARPSAASRSPMIR